MTKFEEELTTITPFIDELGLDNFINVEGVGYIRKDKIIERFKDWEPPKPKVVIPQSVADYIVLERERRHNNWFILSSVCYKMQCMPTDKKGKWIDHNFDKFLKALIIGYEVEKEQLYFVKFTNLGDDDEAVLLFIGKYDKPLIGRLSCNHRLKHKFTEQEIIGIDERYLAFAVPVEEKNEDKNR